MKSSDTITFVNHSSILFESDNGEFSILTDPWYKGLAFNRGWALLFENDEDQITEIVSRSKYIFLSHEHPDHFSVPFFNHYSKIFKNFPTVVFQNTRDKRVVEYLEKKLTVNCLTLKDSCPVEIEGNSLWVFKCGHIDSGFVLETTDYIHINVNDCDYSENELKKIASVIAKKKKPKILYIQFSYASYRPNENWLKTSAERKLSEIVTIYKKFQVDLVIPFASMVYFCHKENFHLNKQMNNCKITSDYLKERDIDHCFLSPKSRKVNPKRLIDDIKFREKENLNSIRFWDKKINEVKILVSDSEVPENLSSASEKFLNRIRLHNSIILLHLVRILSFKFIFGDVTIFVQDMHEFYRVNFFSVKKISVDQKPSADISMSGESFSFFLSETYGFDTLTVNGRFNELSNNGFRKFVFSVGFTIFNQSGYGVRLYDLCNRLILDKILSVPLNIIKKSS